MDNSKVLKPIIGPQESVESKKKESNKKKKALIVSSLAFLIATGTIATSIAVVKANMPKLEIKFDDWFVDSFDFDSMQAFIDENRLSKGEIDKQLPGYVDKKAKDQNVKNADMITNARLTNKIPEDKNNKLPNGIYVEMTAEIDYAFAYQADLSLEDNPNPDQETKKLSSIVQEPKKTRYFISNDRTKLYVLVYERNTDSDEATQDDLKTFNDFHITNTQEAFNKLDQYIAEQNRRYTEDEFTTNPLNYEPGLKIFYDTLIGFEKQYISKDSDAITFPEENGQKVIKIKLDIKRSNFYFDGNNHNVKFEIKDGEGAIYISGLSFFSVSKLNLTNLQAQLQDYIKEFDVANDIDRRYTLVEFRSHLKDDDLRLMILKSVGIIKDNPITLEDPDTEPENPETPEEPTPPAIDTSKINNMYMSNNNLVIDFKCDEKQKYDVSAELGYDTEIYNFDQVNNRLTVKGLKYFTEYDVKNTQSSWVNLNKEIVDISKQYTVDQFTYFVENEDTQQQCKELIAKGLRANGGKFEQNWITKLSIEPVTNSATKIKLNVELDNEFKKYKTDANEQFKIDSKTSSFEIPLTCFEQVEINNLQHDIQEIINAEAGPRYTVEEFEQNINAQPAPTPNELQEKIRQLVETSIPDATNINSFKYIKDDNQLTFELTIPAYKKFPASGRNISYELLRKNEDDSTTSKVTITDLKYWFDFEFTDEDLIKTKRNVEEFIEYYGVSVTEGGDPDENTYESVYKEDIYKVFGYTKLKNGLQLSNFMTFDDQHFKLNGANFVINLQDKINDFGKLRNVKGSNIPNEGITFNEATKVLEFRNFTFSTPLDFFIFGTYLSKLAIVGLTEKGKKQKVLKIPAKKQGEDICYINASSNGMPFKENNNLVSLVMPDTIIGTTGNFLYKCPNLEYVKFSKNLVYNGYSSTYICTENPNLSELVFPANSKLDRVGNYQFRKTALKDFVMPRSTINAQGISYFYGGWGNEYTNKNRSIITWLNNFNGASTMFSGQYDMEAICLLADDIDVGTTPTNIFSFKKHDKYYKLGKYYVKNTTVRDKLVNDCKIDSSIVVVVDNLEEKLIAQGVIPQDW